MIKNLTFFLLALTGLLSCKSSHVHQAPARDENALLWKIGGKNLSRPSYLYGTIHMICPQDFVISDSLKSAFGRAEKIFLEVDMDEPGIEAKMLTMSMSKDKKLTDIFSKEDFSKLNRFFQDSIGMPLALLNPLKPFTLMSLLYLKVLPCVQQESYEGSFVKMAKEQKKEIGGLETLEDQFAVFDKIPNDKQAAMIMDLVNNFAEQKSDFEKMVAYYKAQNITALHDQIVNAPDMKGEEDLLLVNRNKNWIPVIEKEILQRPTLFAVGAGHLGGRDGLISLLRQQGYVLHPIK